MSNLSIFQGANVPANVTHRGVSDLTKSISTGGTIRRIQTNTNGTFRMLIGGEQVGKAIRGEFEAIIVALLPKVGRTFYEGTYDPNAKPTLPDCWSNDGVKPEDNVPNMQATNCAACPQNIIGSGQNGQGRACRYMRRVALMLPGDREEGAVYQFNVPAKSLFGKGQGHTHPFESYIKYLISNDHALDYVVTKIAYDLDADTMQMNFTPMRPITDEEYVLVKAAQHDPETQRLIQITVADADNVTAKPAPKADPAPPKRAEPVSVKEQLKAAAIAAQQADDDDEDEETVEEGDDVPFPAPEVPFTEPEPEPVKPKAAAKPKTPPKPAAVAAPTNPFAADDDDEDAMPTLPVRKPVKPKAEAPKLKPALASVIDDWASED